jgi:small GTP-binding protein
MRDRAIHDKQVSGQFGDQWALFTTSMQISRGANGRLFVAPLGSGVSCSMPLLREPPSWLVCVTFLDEPSAFVWGPPGQPPYDEGHTCGQQRRRQDLPDCGVKKQDFATRTEPTVAPSFISKQVQQTNRSVVVLQVWDTAGQERFASVSQLFFRDAVVAFICFDAQEPSSVQSIHDWVRRVQSEVPDCVLFAVMTKADKFQPEKLDAAVQESKTSVRGIDFYDFFVTSAVSKQGIDSLFLAAAEFGVKGSEADSTPLRLSEKKDCC